MTLSHFAVVRYVPDQLREEYVNIGVVVLSDDGSFGGARFTPDWYRARRLGGKDIAFLRHFAHEFRPAADGQLRFGGAPLTAERLQDMAINWQNAIQFSPVRPSIEPKPMDLLQRLYSQFVSNKPRTAQPAMTKVALVKETQELLTEAFQDEFVDHIPGVDRRGVLSGVSADYTFDVVAQNGVPLLCLDAFSFRAKPSVELERSIDAAAQAVRDVRLVHTGITCGFLAVAPEKARLDFTRLKNHAAALKCPVITQDEVPEWAPSIVRELARSRA